MAGAPDASSQEDTSKTPEARNSPDDSSEPKDISDSPTGHAWVDANNNGMRKYCYIDTRHIMDEYVVVDSKEPTGGIPCDVETTVYLEYLPPNYNDVLETKRVARDGFMADVRQEVDTNSAENDPEPVSGDPGWVDTIGMLPMYEPCHYYFDGTVPGDDNKDDRAYGTESCILSPTYGGRPRTIKKLSRHTMRYR
jgi:hypothetical protein